MQHLSAATNRYYRPELDVVRFLAFLLVFFHHALPDGHDPRVAMLSGGILKILDATANACGFGMSLFFTLSAFLICELLLRERQAVGTVEVKQFYIRRILRIWPLYYLGLALGVVVALLPGGHPHDIVAMGWFVIFLGAWRAAIYAPLSNPMNALWSVSVEEQFYLFAPWITKYLSRRLLVVFCIVVICCSNAWLVHLSHIPASDSRIWFDTFVHFECFAAGILVCLILHGRLPTLSLWQRAFLLLCGWFLWFFSTYSLHTRFHAGVSPGSWHLVAGYAMATLGAISVLIAFLGITSKLLPGWAIYLGRISYGLYVFHVFAMYIFDHLEIGHRASLAIANHPLRACVSGGVDLGLSLGLTILAAATSYRYFETPFLKLKKRHSVIESQPIVGVN
jgi:peptidoglycan/LPS O-acetylase OafA/YrhL